MCVQTGGGSDVEVNFNPNMFNHELCVCVLCVLRIWLIMCKGG